MTEIKINGEVAELLIFFDTVGELALFLASEHFCSDAIADPRARWNYCRETASDLLKWRDAYENFIADDESSRYLVARSGNLIDVETRESVPLPYGASLLILEAQADAERAGFRNLAQVVRFLEGELNPEEKRVVRPTDSHRRTAHLMNAYRWAVCYRVYRDLRSRRAA